MAVRDKVSAIEFTQETGLDPAQIRQAGLAAAEAGKRFLGSSISEASTNGSEIHYLIKGPAGVVKQMAMSVRWQETGNGRRNVRFSVGDFLTTQQRVFLIPVAPKSVPALGSARRFAEALRAELAAS